MRDELSQDQIEQILHAFDETLNNGPWEKSNFLRAIGNNLRSIRDKFITQSGGSLDAVKTDANLINRVALRSGQQEVFIALYNADGGNLHAWEKILTNLPKQVISRPIYADEADIKHLMKSKTQPQNDAYVAIFINQAAILNLPQDKMPQDKFGKPLLALKDRAVNVDNITRFVHSSGSYRFQQGRLIK